MSNFTKEFLIEELLKIEASEEVEKIATQMAIYERFAGAKHLLHRKSKLNDFGSGITISAHLVNLAKTVSNVRAKCLTLTTDSVAYTKRNTFNTIFEIEIKEGACFAIDIETEKEWEVLTEPQYNAIKLQMEAAYTAAISETDRLFNIDLKNYKK